MARRVLSVHVALYRRVNLVSRDGFRPRRELLRTDDLFAGRSTNNERKNEKADHTKESRELVSRAVGRRMLAK